MRDAFKSFTIFDKSLLILAIILFFFAGFLLWDDSLIFGSKDLGTGTAVGEVQIVKNDVRRKSKRDFSWLNLKQDDPLFSGDSLFTGKDSQLQLHLSDGTEMTIAPNTLIVLEKSSSALNLDLKYGEVDRIENAQNKIVLNQGGERSEFTANKAVLSIKTIQGKAELKVITGEVRVKNKTGESKVVAGKKLQMERPAEKPPKLIAPNNNALYFLESKRFLAANGTVYPAPLEFKWEIQGTRSVFLEIAKDKLFKDLVIKKELSESAHVLTEPIEPGKYFWRVGAISEISRAVINSEVQAITLEKDPQLTLTYPVAQARFWQAKNKINQKFSWVGDPLIKNYELEVARDPDFKELVFKETTAKDKAEWQKVPAFGKYFWRVRTALLQSNIQDFTVDENKNPVAVFPPPGSTLILKDFKIILLTEKMDSVDTKPTAAAFEFKWEHSDFAEVWLELSSKADFKEIKFQQKLKENSLKLTQLPAGEFFWRVRGEDPRHAENLASLPVNIKIIPEVIKANVIAPQLTEADKMIEMRPIPGRSPSAVGEKWFKPIDLSGKNRPYLEWNAGGDKAVYSLVISKDKEGNQVVLKKDVTQNRFDWDTMKPGFYYWSVNTRESTLVKESSKSVGTLKVTVPPPVPTGVSLKKEKVLTEEQMKAVGPKAKLSWTKAPLAQSYRVEISRDKNFTKPQRFKSREESAMHAVEGNGTYFYRITALDENSVTISEPGPISEFSFERSFGLYPPVGSTPKFDSSMVFLSKNSSHLVLGWQKVEGATQYEFELSMDSEFKNTYYKGKSKALKEYLPIELPAGKNFWRVRAVSDKYQSDWSDPNPFLVSYGK